MKELKPIKDNASEDTFLAVQDHLINNKPINKKQEKQLERWWMAFGLMTHYKSKTDVARMLIKGAKMTKAQAYRDIRNAEILFGDVIKYRKDIMRYMLVESAQQDVKEANEIAKIALKKDDIQTWKLAKKVKAEAEARICQALGLDKDDPDLPDFSKLQPNQYTIGLDDKTVAMLQNMSKSGSVDLSQMMGDIEDVEHEEL